MRTSPALAPCGPQRRRAGDDRGFGTVEYLAAVGLSLILLVMVANVVVVQYGRGVLRAAVDEAVRDASRSFAGESPAGVEDRCGRRAQEVLHNLLRGRMGRGLVPRCTATATDVTAVIEGRFDGWLPGVPDFDATTRGAAARERPF